MKHDSGWRRKSMIHCSVFNSMFYYTKTQLLFFNLTWLGFCKCNYKDCLHVNNNNKSIYSSILYSKTQLLFFSFMYITWVPSSLLTVATSHNFTKWTLQSKMNQILSQQHLFSNWKSKQLFFFTKTTTHQINLNNKHT